MVPASVPQAAGSPKLTSVARELAAPFRTPVSSSSPAFVSTFRITAALTRSPTDTFEAAALSPISTATSNSEREPDIAYTGVTTGTSTLSRALAANSGQEPDPPRSALQMSTCAGAIGTFDPSANAYLLSDCQTLLEVKEALVRVGELNWDESVPLERWWGVEIGGYPVRVVGLNLQKRGLRGVVPRELGRLAGLENLDLSNNRLTGEIPRELSDLVAIEVVGLDLGGLSGSTLATIGALLKVTELNPGESGLVAEIPRRLGQLGGLRRLNLGGNEITGEIPTSLGSLERLEKMDLRRNQLAGEVPRELSGLTGLRILDLSHNRLTGDIPAGLGDLVAVQVMRLDNNEMSGIIPADLGGLTSVTILNLGQNQLEGRIPPELGQLSELRQLQLGENLLSGQIPSSLGGLTELKTLDLGQNQLEGEIPREMGGLAVLQTLDLSQNRLTGDIPFEFGELVDVRVLRLDDNALSGSIPARFGTLANVTTLNLGQNQLIGETCSLSGSIPARFGTLANVTTLNLGQNQLIGEIPPELGQLRELRQLKLGDNLLTGGIPNSLGNLTKLETVDLGRNRLNGEIPRELGRLSKLQHLLLDENSLQGSLPQELALLTRLKSFDVSNNALGGCVPDDLRDIDWRIGSIQFCGDSPPVYEGGIDLGVTYIERLPRYQRYQLAYFTHGECPYPFGQFRGATVCPEQDGIKRWPDAGESIELIAHVWNLGDTASGPFEYEWRIGEEPVKSGRHEGIGAGEHIAIVFSMEWPDDAINPVVTLAVDIRDEIVELVEDNNAVADWIKGYTLGLMFSPEAYESLRLSNESGGRIQSAEQWVHDHIALMNELMTEAGVDDRARAELFLITRNGQGYIDDELEWYMDGWWVIGGSVSDLHFDHFTLEKYDERPATDWGLIHELMHQLGVIDLYNMHLSPDEVLVPDVNRPGQPAGCGTAYWRFEHDCFVFPRIIRDVMAQLNVEFIGPHTAGGLRANTGYRRGFYGEYLYDTPERILLRVVDKNGDALSDVELWLYQLEARAHGHVLDSVPEIVVATDASGLAQLPNLGITGIVTETGHQLRPNPFGVIDVVGTNGIFLIEMEGPCINYEWLTIVELNLAYWDGQTDEATFTKTLQCPPLETRPDAGEAPGRAVINSVSPELPRCILRDSPHRSERLLTITGENFGSFGDSHLQFRLVDRRVSSIHFGSQVEWVNPVLIRLDIGRIGEFFAEEDRQRVRVRVTDFTYGPLSDWSDVFVVAADAQAC